MAAQERRDRDSGAPDSTPVPRGGSGLQQQETAKVRFEGSIAAMPSRILTAAVKELQIFCARLDSLVQGQVTAAVQDLEERGLIELELQSKSRAGLTRGKIEQNISERIRYLNEVLAGRDLLMDQVQEIRKGLFPHKKVNAPKYTIEEGPNLLNVVIRSPLVAIDTGLCRRLRSADPEVLQEIIGELLEFLRPQVREEHADDA